MDNLNQNLGCPIKPAKRTCPPYGRGSAQHPQKLWGKWCKILHSGHILAHKSQFSNRFFLMKFLLDKSQGTQKLWIKRCKNMQSGHFRGFLWSWYSFWQSFSHFFAGGSFTRSQTSTCLRKQKLHRY